MGGAVVVVVLLGVVALVLGALLSVLRAPGMTTGGRAAWAVAVLVAPVVAALLWFAWGRAAAARPLQPA